MRTLTCSERSCSVPAGLLPASSTPECEDGFALSFICPLVFWLFRALEEALGIDRRHAAGARGGHRLAISLVSHVACRENSGDIGPGGPGLDQDVSGLITPKLALEGAGIGLMA